MILRDRLAEAVNTNPHAAMMEKLEELSAYSHLVLHQFPKIEKFLLSAEIRGCLDQCLRHVVAGRKKHHKKTTLSELDIEVEMLRVLIRRSWRLHYINDHRFEVWSRHVNDIGRMVGGWTRHVRQTGEQSDRR